MCRPLNQTSTLRRTLRFVDRLLFQHRLTKFCHQETSKRSAFSTKRSGVLPSINVSMFGSTEPDTMPLAPEATRALQQSDRSPYMGEPLAIAGAATGPLSGLTFVIKDSYDVEGLVASNGHPEWLASHGPAGSTAPSVQALIDAGATLVGKTVMDELAYSLNGENFFYGTPLNPLAPDRVPGGSSSGCASAVAQQHVTFGLGGDTAGSVRVPASYTGVY